jgi:hypothetical protein
MLIICNIVIFGDDINLWIHIFSHSNINSEAAQDRFQTCVIFELKTKCSMVPRYVGIREISTKGVKKRCETHMV